MRSHPPSLLTLVGQTLREDCELPASSKLLVAVSGGADSTALLHALSLCKPRFSLLAVGVDHGLRAAAAEELANAARFSDSLGIEFVTLKLELHPHGNLQARAREARYEALDAVKRARGLDFIATAHHADDRAETVLLRMLSGATPEALGVLPVLDGVRLRPLTRATKADILLHLSRHAISHDEDPSNRDPRFLRSRVRHELIPLLKELSPRIVEHLNALSNDLSAEPLPELLDDSGQPVKLRRAQRDQLRVALRDRSPSARVLLSGNRAVLVDRKTGQPRVVSLGSSGESVARGDSAAAANKRPEGAKNPKSG